MAETPLIFVSYSHQDLPYLNRLHTHLKPLVREGAIASWDDTKLRTGQKWKEEIEKALSSARAAILLISTDFLASDFIVNNELPPLLAAAQERGVLILPVIVGPCRFQRYPELSQFQAANEPSRPLSDLSPSEQDKVWIKLTDDIEAALNHP